MLCMHAHMSQHLNTNESLCNDVPHPALQHHSSCPAASHSKSFGCSPGYWPVPALIWYTNQISVLLFAAASATGVLSAQHSRGAKGHCGSSISKASCAPPKTVMRESYCSTERGHQLAPYSTARSRWLLRNARGLKNLYTTRKATP